MYPSIIRAWNMDYSTIVLDEQYDNLPGVTYHEVKTDQGTFKFAQGVPAVLPSLLEDLATYRKTAKVKMAQAKARNDDFAAGLHNSEQLAYKVTMNSAYGFTGTSGDGMLACVSVRHACMPSFSSFHTRFLNFSMVLREKVWFKTQPVNSWY